jgi:NarL family two-component system response regulator LiaR
MAHHRYMEKSTPATHAGNPAQKLSRRELDVLEMTARGLTNHQVGDLLHLSVHAVKFHLASIYRKLHVANRTEAAVVYLRGFELPEHETPS